MPDKQIFFIFGFYLFLIFFYDQIRYKNYYKMSVEYKIDSEKIEILLENKFSIDDLIKTVNNALGQTEIPLPILINASNSNEIKSELDLRKFVKFLNQKKDLFIPRIAIFVVQVLRYGTARQIGTFFDMSGIASEPFYNRKEAIAWLMDYKKK